MISSAISLTALTIAWSEVSFGFIQLSQPIGRKLKLGNVTSPTSIPPVNAIGIGELPHTLAITVSAMKRTVVD